MSVRGKPRHGFDFDATFSWNALLLGGDAAREVKGTAHTPDASRDACGDEESALHYEFKIDKAAAASAAEEEALGAAGKALRARLFAALQQLDADMLARMQAQAAPSNGSA